MANQELVMETTHGRKGKCKTEFKAVVNKVLVSGLVLATLMTSTITPALAATNGTYNILDTTPQITTQYSTLSVAENVAEIRATINAINKMRVNGTVKDSDLISLASQLYALEKAVSDSDTGVTSDVIAVLNEAEKSIEGLSGNGANKASTAIIVVRSMLDINAPEIKSETHKAPVYYAQDIGNLKGFYDLGNHEWARPAIEDMSTGTYKGLFSGKTAPNEQGLAQFDPNGTMTRAEFITVVTRALYSDQLANMPAVSGEFWYTNNYDVAVNNGLINENEFKFDKSVLNAPMPREEMALILVRACEQNGEDTSNTVQTSRISDFSTVSESYRDSVLKAFTLGLIAGKDNSGRFDPHATLTRAEGATVLYRLVREDKRVDVTPNDIYNNQGGTVNVNSPITITEWKYGESRNNRNAKEGDIFIKANGEQIVLKKDQYGILGGGQGVAPDVGLMMNGSPVGPKGVVVFTYDVKSYGQMVDSTGMSIQNQSYCINKTTGEGHWGGEIVVLMEKISKPNRDGSYVGEVSSDAYHMYIWDGTSDWSLNFTRGN